MNENYCHRCVGVNEEECASFATPFGIRRYVAVEFKLKKFELLDGNRSTTGTGFVR